MRKIEEEVEIRGRLGLHARPAAKMAKVLNGFKARVWIGRGDKLVDARSILDVLTLGASAGTRLRIVAEGEEAEEALDQIKRVLEACV